MGAILGVIQAAADNDDFREDSKDGKKTNHDTTTVLYRSIIKEEFSRQAIANSDLQRSQQRALKPDDYEHLVKLKHIDKPKQVSLPDFNLARGLQTLDRDYLKPTDKQLQANQMNISWVLGHLSPMSLFHRDVNLTSQLCPSWSAFNSKACAPLISYE